MDALKNSIRAIPDFPKQGILFRDITPVLANPALLREVINALVLPFRDKGITAVAGMEARGFIFGALAASELRVGFIPLRKPGKLPADVHQVQYDLEYGSASLEIHKDALSAGDHVLLVDDLLATGGTAEASCKLVDASGARIAGCAFVVELDGLSGRERLQNQVIHSLIHY